MINELLVSLFIYFILFAIIIYLLWERASIIEQYQKEKEKLLDELSKAVKAVISKNANEYVMTTSIDKVAPENKPLAQETDEVPEEALNDEQFFEAIGNTMQPKDK